MSLVGFDHCSSIFTYHVVNTPKPLIPWDRETSIMECQPTVWFTLEPLRDVRNPPSTKVIPATSSQQAYKMEP